MTFTKSILLGSAAALAAVAGASAADLPSKKAAPAQYVKICDAAGAGYFYIPGSDTCLKISGYAELDVVYNTLRNTYTYTPPVAAVVGPPSSPAIPAGIAAKSAASRNNNTFGVDTEIQLDAVTKTSWGNLHTYIAFEAVNGGGNAYLDNAYLEFAGITAGKHESFYHNIGGLYSSYQTPDYATNLLAYTASFGGGFSATVSLEDPIGPGRSVFGGTLNGTRVPDIIGALRVKQGWGEASLIGGYHQTTYSENVSALPVGTVTNHSVAGYGVMGYISVNLPMLAAGDSIAFQAAWERNALRFGGIGGSSVNGWQNSNYDVYYSTANLQAYNQSGYSLLGYFKHNWTPSVSSEIEGSYGVVNYAANGLATTSPFVNSYSEWRIGHLLAWHPVKNMEIGLDTAYQHYHNKWNAAQIASGLFIPANGIKTNENDFRVQLRLKASF